MHALTQDEVRRLLAAAKAVRERDWLMILVAYLHGLRASEVVGLKPSNIRDGYLTLQRLKGSMKTTQPLLTSVDPLLDERDALIEFAAKSTPGRPIFGVKYLQFRRIVAKHARAAGIPAHKAHPHALKHSVAKHMIEQAGVEKVRQYLGHKSLSSTGFYLEVSDEEASEAAADALGLQQGRLII
jgi:type 1 fimbriae regulatory protein FimB